VHYGNPADFTWDVVVGVSAGSINTAGTAIYATGDEMNMTEYLSSCWENLHTHDIWQFWPNEGPIDWIFHEQGLLDTSPAIQYLTD
jgi:predicted acylesterase/phospholipase RssA